MTTGQILPVPGIPALPHEIRMRIQLVTSNGPGLSCEIKESGCSEKRMTVLPLVTTRYIFAFQRHSGDTSSLQNRFHAAPVPGRFF